MAVVTVIDENRELRDPAEINTFLAPFGIWYERWDVEGRVEPNSSDEQILEAFAPEITRLRERCGFITEDIINVTPETPKLDDIMNHFAQEHTHSEDEVRFTVDGSGIFYVNPENGPVCAVKVEVGDLINVPKGMRHWFVLCEDRTIKCIRMFLDTSGWTADFVDDPVHEKYTVA